MGTLADDKGLAAVDPDPTGAGGVVIHDIFKKLVDCQVVAALDLWNATAWRAFPGHTTTQAQYHGNRALAGDASLTYDDSVSDIRSPL